jgi:hypothetical protein
MGLFSARNLVLGGLAIAAYAAAKNKRGVSGLLGGPGAPEPYTPPSSTGPAPAPAVSNVDVAGPPENTATHVPAPDPVVHDPEGGIDEQAEEAAAAAEAANIGGTPEAYPSEEDSTIPADEATRPLEEAGEGYAEGQELAEADLVDNAEAAGGDTVEGERAVEDAIEAQDQPRAGTIFDAPPPTGAPAAEVPPPGETPADEKSSAVWRIDEQPTVEAEAVDDDSGRGA